MGPGKVTGTVPSMIVTSVPFAADVPGGEACDAGQALGVEQDEQAGDPVMQAEAAVVQEPSCVIPAPLGVVRDAGSCPAAFLGDGQAMGVLAGGRPADE